MPQKLTALNRPPEPEELATRINDARASQETRIKPPQRVGLEEALMTSPEATAELEEKFAKVALVVNLHKLKSFLAPSGDPG